MRKGKLIGGIFCALMTATGVYKTVQEPSMSNFALTAAFVGADVGAADSQAREKAEAEDSAGNCTRPCEAAAETSGGSC